eukprot:CAMPEP_0115764624 /NCGR_PEP_ID=MMETSP0272-20121206/102154_1 /TAXON_ID=71861 /ORGANISM="Scrippsiella trochoidea, Strain CCMP3099" /LENGTH=133 /DNA_ID=CAMNT_0003210413 /DNA_START=229 /DNA_END=627 /DNA_ORIENTATION=-
MLSSTSVEKRTRRPMPRADGEEGGDCERHRRKMPATAVWAFPAVVLGRAHSRVSMAGETASMPLADVGSVEPQRGGLQPSASPAPVPALARQPAARRGDRWCLTSGAAGGEVHRLGSASGGSQEGLNGEVAPT